MKAFTKRIIWFFGFSLLTTIDDLVYFYVHKTPLERGNGIIIWVFILVIPLLFMRDD
ncbi:unnamed protein product, partial [marine sediment metagenome]